MAASEYGETEPPCAVFSALYSRKAAVSSARADLGDPSCITQETPVWRVCPRSRYSTSTRPNPSRSSLAVWADAWLGVRPVFMSTHAFALVNAVGLSGEKRGRSPRAMRRAFSGNGLGDATAPAGPAPMHGTPASKAVADEDRNTTRRTLYLRPRRVKIMGADADGAPLQRVPRDRRLLRRGGRGRDHLAAR